MFTLPISLSHYIMSNRNRVFLITKKVCYLLSIFSPHLYFFIKLRKLPSPNMLLINFLTAKNRYSIMLYTNFNILWTIGHEVKIIQDNNLFLSAWKTEEMLFTFQRQAPTINPMIIDNTSIPLSPQVKYLCVQINEKLRFSEHVSMVKAKTRMYAVRHFF